MSQSDLDIANISRSLYRAEVNAGLQALASNSSGATEPDTTYPNQPWADTSSGYMKLRNAANDDWIVLYELASGGLAQLGGMNLTGAINEERSAIVATATTTPLWDVGTGNIIDASGTPVITDLPDAPQPGARRIVYFAAGTIFTDNANIDVEGNANYTVESGDRTEIEALTTSTFKFWIRKKSGQSVSGTQGFKLPDVDASVASNALTLITNPGVYDFRSTTLTDGTPVSRTLSVATSLVVPNTATLGMVNTVATRLVKGLIDNAGALEEFVINPTGGINLDETTLINTTAISTAADSANVFYSIAARTGVAFRVTGFVDIVQAVAGTWSSNPTLVQPAGGQALASLSSIGYGQTWQTVTRTSSVTYYNTTGKPIYLNAASAAGGAGAVVTITVNGIQVANHVSPAVGSSPIASAVIPPGASYVVGTTNASICQELR
jgi:hypothetical protein